MDDATDWYGPDMATFGDRLAAARESNGMTQKELAKRLGVRTGTLKAWEEDRNEPRANRLSMVAGLLNVSVTWLINGQGDGMETPDDSLVTHSDVADVLKELRSLRADLRNRSEAVGRLEKRVRQLLVTEPEG